MPARTSSTALFTELCIWGDFHPTRLSSEELNRLLPPSPPPNLQVGLPSPSTELLVALSVLLGGATIAGTVRTIQRATAKQMSLPEINRYKAFFGLTKEDDYKEAAK